MLAKSSLDLDLETAVARTMTHALISVSQNHKLPLEGQTKYSELNLKNSFQRENYVS